MPNRMISLERNTNETQIDLTLDLDGTGRYVRFGDEPAIYLMELELLDPMMRLAYQGMEEAS